MCYLEHQAAGVGQSGYLCESLRIHLMASLAFWWVKASDGSVTVLEENLFLFVEM